MRVPDHGALPLKSYWDAQVLNILVQAEDSIMGRRLRDHLVVVATKVTAILIDDLVELLQLGHRDLLSVPSILNLGEA